MKRINDLPIELHEVIIRDNLSINDLFNCRLVNKKFKLATYKCIQKLVIGELNDYINDYWFYNNKLINDDHVISLKCYNEIRSKSIFDFDQHLKYLKIYFNNQFAELLNLNNFINLECLEINSKVDDFKFDINLKDLKYFKLKINALNSTCELNTPKLEKIQFNQINKENNQKFLIKSNPESIKHLITNDYDDELKQIKNLEIIEFTNATNLNENLLSFFNHLKQLKINRSTCFSKELREFLIKILEKKEKLNRDIDIYLYDIKIIDIHMVKEFKSYVGSILEFQLDYYDQLDLSTINELDYYELDGYYENIKKDLPSTFFDKYQNITEVVVNDSQDVPVDEEDLNWFLNNLKNLKSFETYNVSLNRHFLNNLPNSIKRLSISGYIKDFDYDLNHDFILKLTKLVEFNHEVWDFDFLDLALIAFSNLKYLKIFQLIHEDVTVRIEKEDKSIFGFRIIYEDSSKNANSYVKLNYDELVKRCDEFKSEFE